jgi:hypothetical protein
MKRIWMAMGVATVLLLGGCSESQLIDNLEGTWRVGKYMVNNKVNTYVYESVFKDFKWQLNPAYTYTQDWQRLVTDTATTIDTVVTYSSNGEKTTSYDYHYQYTQRWKSYHTTGTWHLVNSNKFLQADDPINGTVLYRIADHGASELVLEAGNGVLNLVH